MVLNGYFDTLEMRDSDFVQEFFCLKNPPIYNNQGIQSNNESSLTNRAVFDAMEEMIKELRDQLRSREALEAFAAEQRECLREKESELEKMRVEVDALRKQKDGLLKALG